MSPDFLIFTADDFGAHEYINEAVERAVRDGVLTAASLMVTGPAAADAIRRARELPNLRVGLHVVLADGFAMLAREHIASLVDEEGRFGDRMAFDGVRFFAHPGVRKQLTAEIRAQFAAFAATGLELDHVNAHKHFHLHPTILSILVEVGREFGMQAMRWPREPRSGTRLSLVDEMQRMVLSPWLALMQHRIARAHLAHNDWLCGLSSTGRMDETTLLEMLSHVPPGVTEFYFHPATQSGAAINRKMAGYQHAEELAALTSPRVRERLDAMGVARGGFSDWVHARGEEDLAISS